LYGVAELNNTSSIDVSFDNVICINHMKQRLMIQAFELEAARTSILPCSLRLLLQAKPRGKISTFHEQIEHYHEGRLPYVILFGLKKIL